MKDYTVTIEAACPRRKLDLERIYDLGEHLEAASISHDQGDDPKRYGATFSVHAENGIDAVDQGQSAWIAAHDEAGVRGWTIVNVHAVLSSDVAAENERSNFPDLVGIGELADMIDATRQRAHSLARSHRFPPPAAELMSGPVFLRSSVEAFLSTWERKPGRPRKESVA